MLQPPATVTLADLVAAVCRFRDERDWSQFHTPKNLAAATAIEAAELQEQVFWKFCKLKEANKCQAERRSMLYQIIPKLREVEVEVAEARPLL